MCRTRETQKEINANNPFCQSYLHMFIDLGFRIGSISNRRGKKVMINGNKCMEWHSEWSRNWRKFFIYVIHMANSADLGRCQRRKEKRQKSHEMNANIEPKKEVERIHVDCHICMCVYCLKRRYQRETVSIRYIDGCCFFVCLFAFALLLALPSLSHSPISLPASFWHLCVPFILHKKSIDWVNDISFQLINTSVAHLSYVMLPVMLRYITRSYLFVLYFAHLFRR